MKIGIISDIHGNSEALKVVLEKLTKCERILCAGDLTGYYPDFNKVIDVVKNDPRITSILGNHDIYHLKDKNITSVNRKYLRGLKDSLILNIDNLKIGLFHGSPDDSNKRLYPDSDFSKLEDLHYDFLILGHTHYPMIKKIGKMVIINPGSVGQPRDFDPRAAYAILNTRKKLVQIYRVRYNIEAVCKKVLSANLDPALCEILKRTK